MQRIDSTRYVRLLWESNEEEDKGSHAAILEVKFGKEGRQDHSLIRVSEHLIRFSVIWNLLHSSLKAVTSRTISCLLRNVFETPRKGNW